MIALHRSCTRLVLALISASLAAIAAPGDVESGFPTAALTVSFGDLQVFGMAVQSDGKIIVGGSHEQADGLYQGKLTRLNADGSRDASFKSYVNGWVYAVAVQADGKILVAGGFTTVISPGPPYSDGLRRGIARLNADGSLDTTFDADITGNSINSMAVQADGKILITGYFSQVGATARTNIARLNSNGTLDAAFNPVLGQPYPNSFIVQPDGSIFIIGSIGSVGGVTRYGMAKLTSAGVLDTTFDAGFLANGSQVALRLPDGKLLVDGYTGAVRLTATGALDATFTSLTYDGDPGYKVRSIVLQADGKVIIGGKFTGLNGTPRNRVARLNADGTLDTTFNADGLATTEVLGLMLQGDGRLLVGSKGAGLKRVLNDVATETLTAPTATSVQWLRGSTMPEVASVQFDQSTNGTTWTLLGAGTRIAGGWQLTGTSVTGSFLRARAATLGGYFQGSLMPIISEAITPAGTPQLRVQYPASTYISSGSYTLNLGALEVGASSATFGLTLLNEGTDTLKPVLAAITGPNASDFSVVQLSSPNMAVAATRTFNVVFKPSAIGTRSATLHITSNDPATPDFTIALTGTGLLSSNANLASLAATSAVFTPAFAANTLFYTANVQSHVVFITVTPTLAELNATMTINGNAAASGVAASLSLVNGANVFTIIVTAQNGTTTKTYTLTVNRAASIVPGDLDPTLNLVGINATVRATALQSDGKLLVGGFFNEDPAHQGILRLNADETVDTSFNASMMGGIQCMMVLETGKILIAGSFSGIRQGTDNGTLVARNNIALLNADGTVDATFNPNIVFFPTDPISGFYGTIECMALQPDGKILVGGYFNKVGATARKCIARLTAAGALDTTFNAGALTFSYDDTQTAVESIVVQANGKIVFGGQVDAIGATARAGIARVSTTGALDTTFDPPLIGALSIIRLLPDQRLLVSSTSADNLHNGLVLLSSAGVVDDSYTAGVAGDARSLILQADGGALLCGYFANTYVGSTPGPARGSVARFSATGVLDTVFNPIATFNNGATAQTDSLMVLESGKIVIGGQFDAIAAFPRGYLARIMNSTTPQSIANVGQTTVEWLRGGALPEAEDVSFDLSTDGGNTFTVLGDGTRITGGWQLTGLNLPVTGGILRGRARCLSGFHNSSSGWSAFQAPFAPAPPKIVVEYPLNNVLDDGDTINLGTLGLNVLIPVTFTVRNAGGQALTLSNVTVSGTNAAMFTITDQPTLSVGSLDSTTFTVQAKLTSSGAKTAFLNLVNNDITATPFNIQLNATGAPAVLPTATTNVATGLDFDPAGMVIDIARATLNASIDAKGQPRDVAFEYGPTTAYGTTVPLAGPFTATGTVAVSTQLTGLPPHTLFHYRVRVDGDLGNALGLDKTFTTANHAPVADNDTAFALASAATTIDVLNGDTDADGDSLTITAKSAVAPTTAGTLAIVANQLVFTANAAFGTGANASATFTYTISDGEGGTNVGSVTVTPGSAMLDITTKSIFAEGTAFENPSSYPVAITTSGSWAVTEALAWASVAPASGVGNGIVHITVQPNTTTSVRIGIIKIGGVAHTITQAAVVKPTLGPLVGSPFEAIVGGYFELVIPTTNAPVTYVATNLPPGLTLNNSNGLLSGRPTMTGTTATNYNVTVKASNAAGPIATDTAGKAAATLTFTIHVVPLPAGVVGTFNGLIERSTTLNLGPTPNLGARWQMNVSALGGVDGKIIEGVTTKSFTGQLEVSAADADHPTLTAAIPGTPYTLDLKLDATQDSLSSTPTDNTLHNASNSQTSLVTGWGNAWSSVAATLHKATAYKAQHNFIISTPTPPTSTSATIPGGYGFGSFIVSDTNGALNITGQLPDGSKLLCSTFIGQHGEVLLYTVLHGNKGSIHGPLVVTAATAPNAPADNTLAGSLTWLKPTLAATDKDTAYKAGFGPIALAANGSTYDAPDKGQRVLGLPAPAVMPVTATNAKLAFTLGGLDLATPSSLEFNQLIRVSNPSTTGLTNTATVAAYNLATSTNLNKVAITTFTAPTGLFAGSFTLPGTPARLAPFNGQIVRTFSGSVPTTQGYGYFLQPSIPGTGETVATSPKLSGRVVFSAP